MGKERLVAFTDAVIAIVITVLVLDLELLAAPTMEALWEIRESRFAGSNRMSMFALGVY